MPAAALTPDLATLSAVLTGRFDLRFAIGLELECYLSTLRINVASRSKRLAAELADPRYHGVSLTSETGSGQIEFRFDHRDDLSTLPARVDLMKAVTASHGRLGLDRASFQARPHFFLPGSGLHVNLSFTTTDGVISPMDQEAAIRKVIAGLLLTMPRGMIFFAPAVESYFRFRWQSESEEYRFSGAPRTISWSVNDRGSAIRLVRAADKPADWRIEHRVPCADADPAWVIAAILLGAAYGLESLYEPVVTDTLNSYRKKESGVQFSQTLDDNLRAWESPELAPPLNGGRFGAFWSTITGRERDEFPATFSHRLNELYTRSS